MCKILRMSDELSDEIALSHNDGSISLSDYSEATSSDSENSIFEPFDIRLPVSHSYLKSSELGELASQPIYKDPGTTISVPVLVMETVLLPGQTLPLHFVSPSHVNSIREMARKHAYFCLMSLALKTEEEDFDYFPYQSGVTPIAFASQVGTLFKIKNVGVDDDRLTIQAVGRQRCRLLSKPREADIFYRSYKCLIYSQMDVCVLEEVELTPSHFCYLPDSRSLNRLQPEMRKRFYSLMSHHTAFAIHQFSTNTIVKRLKNWLQKWFDLSRINMVINQGYTVFSYWVASNLPVDMNIKLSLLEELCTDRRLYREWRIASQVSSMACAVCGDIKFDVDDMLNLSVEGNGTHFVNPGGVVHEMFTVSKINNSELIGHSSTEFSWFPGYAWTILNCEFCGSHIGWRFTSSKLTPRKFFGITRRNLKLVKSEHLDDI